MRFLFLVCALALAAADDGRGGRGRRQRRKGRGGRFKGAGTAAAVVTAQPVGEAPTAGYYHSVGKLSPLPRQALDIASHGAPERIAATRGYRGELILFTADSNMAGWGFHFVQQLRAQVRIGSPRKPRLAPLTHPIVPGKATR